jgi:hypothetical protein
MGDFFADGTNTTGLVSKRNPYLNEAIGLGNAAYPPLAYDLFFLLAHASTIPEEGHGYLTYYYQPLWTMLFTITLCFTFVLIHFFSTRQLRKCSTFDATMVSLALCFSRPMLYTVERGNILIVTMLATSIYIFYYDSNNKWIKEIALISLAIAAGIKLTPALLGILLLYKKDWKAAIRTIIYGLLFFLVPFLFLKGGLHNLQQLISNVRLHFTYYPDTSGTGLVACFYKYAKIISNNNYEMSSFIHKMLTILRMIISFTLLTGAALYKEKWKTIFNVIIVLLILPSVSGEYCLIYLLPATILFLDHLSIHNVTKSEIIIVVCMIMIYFVYRNKISARVYRSSQFG